MSSPDSLPLWPAELQQLKLNLSQVHTVALNLPNLTALDVSGCPRLTCLELRCAGEAAVRHLGLLCLLGAMICVAQISQMHLAPRGSNGCSTAPLEMAHFWGCAVHKAC